MRALNKQQLQTLRAGLEPDVENLIMQTVLPAKRAAIEASTDGPNRPGFTDVNDPYTHCLREIERRIDGTSFANGVDRDDLTCRAITQVASETETIRATTNPTEREAMQHALPQTVMEGFVRNKFPELRHMETLPGVVMDPAGRPFALDPEMHVRVDVAADEEAGQTSSIIGAFRSRNRTHIVNQCPGEAGSPPDVKQQRGHADARSR